MTLERRSLLALGAGLAAGLAEARPAGATSNADLPDGSRTLRDLTDRLAKAPRRRDFKTVPMILDRPDLWDHEALSEVIAYKGGPRQVWDNTDIGGPWLNLMRNALNNQVWSFKHPDFLAASATHGSANIALYDQAMWDKYQLTKLAGEAFKANTLLVPKESGSGGGRELPGPGGDVLAGEQHHPALMARGVVFLSCHNAIWEQAAALIRRDLNRTSSRTRRWRRN